MQPVEAQIRINHANTRHIAIVVLLLAGLLSAFFWLGFWVADAGVVSERYHRLEQKQETGNSMIQPRTPFSAPTQEKPPPVEQLDINPQEVVRL